MPERDEPDFDWLYGTQGKGVGSSGREDRGRQDAPDGADDATRVQPVQGGQRPPSRDPEPTEKLPTLSRRGSEQRRRGAGRGGAGPPAPPAAGRGAPRPPPRAGGPGGFGVSTSVGAT